MHKKRSKFLFLDLANRRVTQLLVSVPSPAFPSCSLAWERVEMLGRGAQTHLTHLTCWKRTDLPFGNTQLPSQPIWSRKASHLMSLVK